MIAQRVATGTYPSGRTDVRERIRATQVAHARTRNTLEPAGGYDDGAFARTIRPLLTNLPASLIAAEVGLSVEYSRAIRNGRRTPARDRWALFHLVGLKLRPSGG